MVDTNGNDAADLATMQQQRHQQRHQQQQQLFAQHLAQQQVQGQGAGAGAGAGAGPPPPPPPPLQQGDAWSECVSLLRYACEALEEQEYVYDVYYLDVAAQGGLESGEEADMSVPVVTLDRPLNLSNADALLAGGGEGADGAGDDLVTAEDVVNSDDDLFGPDEEGYDTNDEEHPFNDYPDEEEDEEQTGEAMYTMNGNEYGGASR